MRLSVKQENRVQVPVSPHSPLAQSVEATVLETVQCEFESHEGYYENRK